MTQKNDRDIIEKFADLFDLAGDVTTSQMQWGFQGVGQGWLEIMNRLCTTLLPIAPEDFRIVAVKSKFSTLRLACRGGDDATEKVIEAYKAEALTVCSQCGAAGEQRTVGGELVVRCGTCTG